MKQLGTLTKVPINKMWEKEIQFSAWLAEKENIALLGKTIGVDLLAEKREARVGGFSADILAKEDGGDRLVIIENEYDNTNHEHLGKLITYAAGRGAKILIWVVEKARDEHRAAVQWLNENTNSDIGVFLVQIELYSIETSLPAPKFTVLESPNDWIKSTRQNATLSESELKIINWWNSFMDYAMNQPDFAKHFNRRKALSQQMFRLPIGSAQCEIRLSFSKKKLEAGVFITNNMSLYNTLHEHKDKIEEDLGLKMDWHELPQRKASKVVITLPRKSSDPAENNSYFKWYCEKAIALKRVFSKYI